MVIIDIEKEKQYKFKIEDSSKLSYFRKYSEPSDENLLKKRESKKILSEKCTALEKIIKEDDILKDENKENAWDIYYFLHSHIYFGLDYAMKVNNRYEDNNNNDGVEESFRLILCILFFISKYFKYLLDNKDQFIYYENNLINKDNSELLDLKIVNKKYSFFSFFEESLNLLKKIFANSSQYLPWFLAFDEEIKEFIPSIEDEKVIIPDFCPLYEENKEEEENEENKEKEQYTLENEKDEKSKKKKKILLKKICLSSAYKYGTTFTTERYRIRAAYVAYFIDYFHALNGFSYLFQLCYCNISISVKLLLKLVKGLSNAKSMTGSYSKICIEEKKQLKLFINNYIDNLNEKTIEENDNEDIINLIIRITQYLSLEKVEQQKLLEKLYFNYISKNLLFSKNIEQKIDSLNKINDIFKSINPNYEHIYSKNYLKIKIDEMTLEEFCINFQKNKILQNLLNSKNIHEEIIIKFKDILFTMYQNNFGYLEKADVEKAKFEKKMLFDILFNKLYEYQEKNERDKYMQKYLCDFCVILSNEDKFYVFQQIKKFFEKIIEKRGIPIKDDLSFIIEYTLKAMANSKEDENKEINENKKENKIIKIKENINISNYKNEQMEILSLEDEDFYGTNIILKYISEDNYNMYNMNNEQKKELIHFSIKGIIQIIKECNRKDILIKHIIFRTIFAIKNSKDIIQYLIILEIIKNNKEINSKFYLILDEESKKYSFLSTLISDMNRYITLINNLNSDNNDDNGKEDKSKEGKKVYEGVFDNELNIKLRLELIIFLLQKNMTDQNMNNFKMIINAFENNNFACDFLNKYFYNNLTKFDSNLIQFFYTNIFLTKDKLSYFNNMQYYMLCKEVIVEINTKNKIFYFMNNKDLVIINCSSQKEIQGIDLLWKFLIKTKNDEIRNNVTNFLADIFFGIKLREKEKMNNYWENYIKLIYNKLDDIIHLEKENRNEKQNEQTIQAIISLIKKIRNKFSYKGEIIGDLNQIKEEINLNKAKQISKSDQKEKEEQRENKIYKNISIFGNLYGKENILNYNITIDNSEYFYMLRYQISSFYKIPVNLVTLILDESKFDRDIQEKLNTIEFNLFYDFDNIYSLIDNIEKKINKNKSPLIFKVIPQKDNKKIKYIKELIIDFPKLIQLLKRKQVEYLLDVWCLIKEDNIKINPNVIEIIKEILKDENSEKFNSIFNFEDTNIYYISYILFHLNNVINELNANDDKFINNIFLKSKIWNGKIKNIKLECSKNQNLEEIYEKNNIINNLLNIYKIISKKTEDKNILLIILNNLLEYYYKIVQESVSINFKNLSSTENINIDKVEDLYISNANIIEEIIIQNKIIYESLINLLIKKYNDNEENQIKVQFEFLYTEGLLKNRIYSLNQKLKSFFLILIDFKFLDKIYKDKKIISDFYILLLNLFFNSSTYIKIINYIKNLVSEQNNNICLNLEKYENNIKLYFDMVINLIDKVNPITYNKFNFKEFLNEICLKNITNPIIEGIPIELSFHEIIFGGNCKLLVYLLNKSNNYKELLQMKDDEEQKLKLYLFNEIIMNKCNKNIFNENNIDNYKTISISTSYAFKEATNLFIFLLVQNINDENETENNDFFDKLTELHSQNYWKGDSISDWKLDSKDSNRLAPYIGLKNLGCTCYMNSLLQVFFNFIPFRESLLRCKCKEEKKNVLYQIKKLFYSLKYLQINYYAPTDFPSNFDDEILNVHLQMDIDEFFGQILDKIENRLKNTKNENLVKFFFQGRQNDILKFQGGCSHHRTNTNNFYSIQLVIKNKKNIYESLDSLIEGELMNGENCIFCPECKKKLPAVKSQNFKTLPRMLIFVLKRFEFNYKTMEKIKINDYYEFPVELDMSKYITEDSKEANLNQYSLKSVVVHKGNSDGGHYYAFIKTNNDQWYNFNDTQVTPFDIDFLREEAYGGEEIYNENGNKEVKKKNRNAYLLFYEKKIQTNCEQFNNVEAIESFIGKNNKSQNNINIIQNNIEGNKIMNNNEKVSNIINEIEIQKNDIKKEDENENGIKDILEDINKEMFKYFLNKKLFSNEYQYFILELYLNILNYYYSNDLPVFLMHLSRNSNNREMPREVQAISSNINSYIKKNKLILFSKKQKNTNKPIKYMEQIFNLFKHFIIYFFNILLRTKEKEYFGGMVDLIKFILNENSICANYLIEEFCNKNVIIEYLINCPRYEIKKVIVGILYCAMIKSINEYQLTNIKKGNEKTKKNLKSKLKSFFNLSSKGDEELTKQLNNHQKSKENYIYSNPLEYKNIPPNILKMIYNILHLIRDIKYCNMNEQRFLYFTIYRFSLISEDTREFLINKCRLFELLCLMLHKNCATFNYDTEAIISSTYVGPYTVSHSILNSKGKKDENIILDKAGQYRIENYIYLLFFYLLSFSPKKKSKNAIKEDEGFSLNNKEFVKVLLNNIRTKQDAFSFSKYINEKSKNNNNRIIPVFEALIEYLNKVDNNENINYDYNNYNNFENNNMNENPSSNDPGMDPKYLLIILKRFISTLNYQDQYVQKYIKYIFKVFWNNQNYYNYCIMIIDFLIEIFTNYLTGFISVYKKDLEKLLEWFERNPIAPTLYHIDGISLYKYQKKQYDNNIPEEKIKEFEEKEFEITTNRVNKIRNIINNGAIGKIENYEKEIDLTDFQFIIGDIILYDKKEYYIEEALDELLKISNGKNNKGEKKEIWIEIDNPKIEIKELKGK